VRAAQIPDMKLFPILLTNEKIWDDAWTYWTLR
jgi:hypothetical protein